MTALQLSLAILALCLVSSGCSTFDRGEAEVPEPPRATQRIVIHTNHGDERVDEFYWLRERENPAVIEYLEQENAYMKAVMQHTDVLQDQLYEEMVARIKETDLSVPYRMRGYWYYSRTEEGKSYSIQCRKKGNLDAPEEIFLDQNAMAEGHEYFRIGTWRVSPDDRLLAFAVDTEGDERHDLRFRDMETGMVFPETVPDVAYSVAWANDNRTVFYTVLDEASRPWRIYRHRLGDDPANDELIHQEDDERFYIGVSRTLSGKFLILGMGSQITTEIRYLSADDPTGEFRTIHPRQQGMEYSVVHHGDSFFVLTNDGATNFKLMQAPTSDPSKENWTEVIAHRDDVMLDDVDAFADHLVVHEREDGLPQILVRRLSSGDEHRVTFPEPAYSARATGNAEFETDTLRFRYTSMVTPESIFDYEMNTRERELMKQTEVLGGYDPDLYVAERIHAKASDGTPVPISIVYRNGTPLDGSHPMLLQGYGSYGANYEPTFSSVRLSLLDRGFVVARAHIRGGGEMGRQWYEDGKFLKKRNTFTDFVACAEHLIDEGYTSPERLAISGGSAGGLLMGAVANMRPELFHCVVANVPFVDVVTTMLDESIPLTVIEFEEWGNPKDATYYEYMKSYSPYDNVESKEYPNLLITAGLNDPRVQYWEPAKWTARLRDRKTDENLLLLKTNMGAGHGGASGRYDRLRELAFEYAFLIDQLAPEASGGAPSASAMVAR